MKTLEEIARGLAEAARTVERYFGELPPAHIHRRRAGAWAPIDDLAHLNLTTGLTLRGLSLPRRLRADLLPPAERASRSYEELHAQYLDRLREGFRSPQRFVPREAEAEAEAEPDGDRRERTLEEWRRLAGELQRALDGWDDSELERFAVTHPALGTLTIREILYFTHIHALHHVEVAKRRLDES